MFNLLVSADGHEWESTTRMGMFIGRFLEYSGDECEDIAVDRPESLKVLETIPALLLYEDGVAGPAPDVVRVGQLRDIRVRSPRITFRFTETGRLDRDVVVGLRRELQLGTYELTRTHWAVKDGELPLELHQAVQPTPQRYDVVLSFAGEDREYVEQVADNLDQHGVSVFYDKYEAATMWGKDLSEHLDSVYRRQGRYCVIFISSHYAKKMWTTHERRSALARAVEEQREYILPARFDDTEVPGLRPSIVYQDLRTLSPDDLAALIRQKLGRK